MPPTPVQVHNTFVADVASNDTSPLTAEEEEGGYTSLAFSSAMAGLLTEVFDAWSGRTGLVGWVAQGDGSFEATHFVDDSVDALGVDVIGMPSTSRTRPANRS